MLDLFFSLSYFALFSICTTFFHLLVFKFRQTSRVCLVEGEIGEMENKRRENRRENGEWCCLVKGEGEKIFLWGLGNFHPGPHKICLSKMERKQA